MVKYNTCENGETISTFTSFSSSVYELITFVNTTPISYSHSRNWAITFLDILKIFSRSQISRKKKSSIEKYLSFISLLSPVITGDISGKLKDEKYPLRVKLSALKCTNFSSSFPLRVFYKIFIWQVSFSSNIKTSLYENEFSLLSRQK